MKKRIRDTIKELEKYYRVKNFTLENIINRIEYIDTELIGVGAIEYSDMPKAKGSKVNYRKEKLIEEKTELQKKLNRNIAFVKLIESALGNIDSVNKKILVECYAKDKRERNKEYVLYTSLNISSSTFYRLKKEALEEFSIDLFGVD